MIIIIGTIAPIIAVLPTWLIQSQSLYIDNKILLYLILGLLFIIFIFLLPKFYRIKLDNQQFKYIIGLLGIFFLVIKFLYVVAYEQTLMSDFLTMWDYAIDTYNANAFIQPINPQTQRPLASLVPLVWVFGTSTLVFKIANIFFIIFASIIASHIMAKLTSYHSAILTFILISLVPEVYFASLIPTHDIPSVFYLFCYVLIAYRLLFSNREISLSSKIFYAILLICIGLVFDIQRGLFIILIATLILLYILQLFLDKGVRKKLFLPLVIIVIPIIGVISLKYILTNENILVKQENAKKIIKHGWSFIHPHTFSDGQYGTGVKFFTDFVIPLESEHEIEYYKKAIKLSDIYYNISERPFNYALRAKTLYMLGIQDYFYYTNLKNITQEKQNKINSINSTWNTIFVPIFLLLLLISTIGILFISFVQRRTAVFIYFPLLFMSLISIGLLLMGENQPRYMFLGWFFWSMIISSFLNSIYSLQSSVQNIHVAVKYTEILKALLVFLVLGTLLFIIFRISFSSSEYRLLNMHSFSDIDISQQNLVEKFDNTLDDKQYSTLKLKLPIKYKQGDTVKISKVFHRESNHLYKFGVYLRSSFCSKSPCMSDMAKVHLYINDKLFKTVYLCEIREYIYIKTPIELKDDNEIKITFEIEALSDSISQCKYIPTVDFKFASLRKYQTTKKSFLPTKISINNKSKYISVINCQTNLQEQGDSLVFKFDKKNPEKDKKAGIVIIYPQEAKSIKFSINDLYSGTKFLNRMVYKIIYDNKTIFRHDISDMDGINRHPIHIDLLSNDKKVYILLDTQNSIEQGWGWGDAGQIKIEFEK